ncbi:hypothetical protein AB6A40_006048 [Gnathostoma spinigerum]|uniref:Structural maintenance of chromosomes protein 5 n=1 Tax=Gnathostoma spinigerum TaxID=75299 RepID=A0ABD6EPW4_9BILA
MVTFLQMRNWEDEMETAVEKWLNPLKSLVVKISLRFASFCQLLGIEGKVRLDEPNNRFDIDKYGLTILIKFRTSEALQPLTHQVQSGGERSVATMLYLMALQELSPVPFRCVDEINQGMDPVNERRVLELLMKILENGHNLSKTQYFVLTPKLIHGIKYSDRVKIIVPYNGCEVHKKTVRIVFIDSTDVLDFGKFRLHFLAAAKD